MKNRFLLLFLGFFLPLLVGCTFMGTIFKTGVGVGVFLVVALILIIFLFTRIGKRNA